MFFYAAVFILSAFVPNEFVSVAFDSGGVTTGPITVPFIMAMGVGLASIRGDRGSQDDSFGLVALCSVGPILAVLILGICFRGSDPSYTPISVPNVADTRDVALAFARLVVFFAGFGSSTSSSTVIAFSLSLLSVISVKSRG